MVTYTVNKKTLRALGRIPKPGKHYILNTEKGQCHELQTWWEFQTRKVKKHPLNKFVHETGDALVGGQWQCPVTISSVIRILYATVFFNAYDVDIAFFKLHLWIKKRKDLCRNLETDIIQSVNFIYIIKT